MKWKVRAILYVEAENLEEFLTIMETEHQELDDFDYEALEG